MAVAAGHIGHEDRLDVVEHLTELRTRLIVSLAVTLLAMGLVFQVPVAILAATRAGMITSHQLRHNRRYAILACGAVAAFLPGDAITLVLETVPLYLLFEMSLLLATLLDRRSQRAT